MPMPQYPETQRTPDEARLASGMVLNVERRGELIRMDLCGTPDAYHAPACTTCYDVDLTQEEALYLARRLLNLALER